MAENSLVVTYEIKRGTVDDDDTDHHPIRPDNSNSTTHSRTHHSGIDNTDYGQEFEGALQNKDTDPVLYWEDDDTPETKFSDIQDFLNMKRALIREVNTTRNTTTTVINNFPKYEQEDQIEADDAQKIADEIGEVILKKRKESNKIKIEKIEGEDSIHTNIYTGMEENNAQHMFKQEPKLSADSELLKRQVGAWRVVLQRLPITAVINNFPKYEQEDQIEADDAQKIADEIGEVILKKREESNKIKIEKIEGEDSIHTNIYTGMEENNTQHMFKQEPKLSADSELLKRQVGAWRVVLQRLPITADINRRQNDIIMKMPLKKIAKKNKPYKCKICDYKCIKRSYMKRHSMIHTGEKPFKCSTCDYRCINSGNLKIHSYLHTGEKPFKCSTCDYQCVSSSYMKRHSMAHTGEKPYKCKTCNYMCVQYSNMKRHSMKHTGEKPFKCSICDYKCISSSYMKRHSMAHTGEKPYKCKTCNYKCVQYSNMKRHNMVHTGEKPFKCSTCDFQCITNSHLKRHSTKHTSEKPYECNICGFRSTRSYYLKKHIMKHIEKKL